MPKIAVLTDELVNKIAAGEVVERPASVIKELCENAVDAGARSIRVQIQGGGLASISVRDDGIGMAREDARLCLIRHATSKLRDAEGLFEILTMGFRGEALPSIAAVSRFTLHTSERGAPVGTEVVIEGGSEPEVRDAAPLGGTLIRVEELFFNTPARRKFLRREDTETRYAEDAVIRIALPHPEIAFHFESNGKVLFTSPANPDDLRERIAAAISTEVHPHLLPVEEARLGITVRGFVAGPGFHLPNARGLYTFVNRRYIRDRGLNHSVQRAFSEFLPPGRQPVAVLFIEVDPRTVDVNVHPQKIEVRFADGRGVYDAVFAGVSRALRAALGELGAPGGIEPPATAEYADAVERFLARAQQTPFGGPLPLPSAADAPVSPYGFEGGRPSFGLLAPDVNQAPPTGYFGALRFLGDLASRFWVCEGRGGGLVVLDPHAARERVAMAQLRRFVQGGAGSGQRSLFSATVELGPSEAKHVTAMLGELETVGLELEPFGGSHFALKSVPPPLEGIEAQPLLQELAAVLAAGGEVRERLLQVMACHAASSARAAPGEQVRASLAQLEAGEFLAPLRHSSVVVSETSLLELERRSRNG